MRKSLSRADERALRALRNYLVHHGRLPSVRELMRNLGYSSPRSASWLIERLREKGYLKRRSDGGWQLAAGPVAETACAQTVDVPLVGSASCGSLLLAEENIEVTLPVSVRLAPAPYKHFLLRASGDSMNKRGINDGDLVLVRQVSIARNGDSVVALVDNEATIKELQVTDGTIILLPRSINAEHRPIVLARDFQIQGVVVASFPDPASLVAEERKDE